MSEMSDLSAGSGDSADAPSSTDQPLAADDQTAGAPERQPQEVAGAPAKDGPPPEAAATKLPEPGKASAPADRSSSPAGGQTGRAPKPSEPGQASALVGEAVTVSDPDIDQPDVPHIIGKVSLGDTITPIHLDHRAWENVTPFSGSKPSVIVESYRLQRGQNNLVNYYDNGRVKAVTLTDADFEKALLWGQPDQSQLNEFERNLVAGKTPGGPYSMLVILIDPEAGTVGYRVYRGDGGAGGGSTIFSRSGEVLGRDIGPGLEPPGLLSELLLSGIAGLGGGIVKAAAKGLIRGAGKLGGAVVKSEVKQAFAKAPAIAERELIRGADELGNAVVKDEVEQVSAKATSGGARAVEARLTGAVASQTPTADPGFAAARSALEQALRNPGVGIDELGRIGAARTRGAFRRRLVSQVSDPSHPLNFLLRDGRLRSSTAKGITELEWLETPEIIEAGHAQSAKAFLGSGVQDRFMVMTAYENRLLSATVEHPSLGGSIDVPWALEIKGVPVQVKTAIDWVAKELLEPRELAEARRIIYR